MSKDNRTRHCGETDVILGTTSADAHDPIDEWPLTRPQTICLVLGLSLFWPFFNRYGFSSFFTDYSDPVRSMWGAYAGIILGLVCLYLIGVALRRQIEPLIMRHRLMWASISCIGACGYLLFLAAPVMGLTSGNDGIQTISGALLALSYAALTFGWFKLIVACGGWNVYIYIVLSFALGTLYPFIAYAPTELVWSFSILSPITSAICWFVCTGTAAWSVKPTDINNHNSDGDDKNDGTCDGDAVSDQLVRDDLVDYRMSSLLKLPIVLLALFGAFLIVGAVLVGLFHFKAAGPRLVERLICAGVVIVVAITLLIASRRAHQLNHILQSGWLLLALLFFIGMIMMLAPDNRFSLQGSALVQACLGCFELFLWFILAMDVIRYRLSTMLVFGLAFAFFKALPNCIGKYVIPNQILTVGTSDDMIDSIILIALAMLLVMTFMLLGRRSFMQSSTDVATVGSAAIVQDSPMATSAAHANRAQASSALLDAFQKTTNAIAEKAGLTERELDVMRLIAKGYSYQAIADELCISLSTVQGHTKNVYRKLGVHSKQEVISYVRDSTA